MVQTIEEICAEKEDYFNQFYMNYKSIHPLLAENDEDFETLFSCLARITGQNPPSKDSVSKDNISEILQRIVSELDSFVEGLSGTERKALLRGNDDYESFLEAAETIVEKYS